jgi:hypothetical protein
MKKSIIFILLFSIVFTFASSAEGLQKVRNSAFKRGEVLKYRIFYDSWLTSYLTAGIGTLSVLQDNKKFHNRDTYHLEVLGKSVGIFNWFFKVDDRYESYIDEDALIPWFFMRRTKQGSYTRDDNINFNQFDHLAKSNTIKRKVPSNIQDVVSSFYMMRNLDYNNAKIDQEFRVEFMLDDSLYISRIIYLGKDVVKTKAGKFNCMKFKPKVVRGEMFDEEYPMTLWISDDKNHIPVLLRSEVIIGSVKVELIECTGLANPQDSKIE